ncbi:MAG: nucleotidyltransferase family protein, partial [Sphingomonadaceae bacterium]|nr:nucleotidyltransferase family protein [Sphingomonadaceae bacterium]
MHELPPLAHGERGSVIDVHHTILPLTARLRPDADALIAAALPVGDGLSVLSPPDMLLHSVAHLFYDGDFEGGLRNLWDIHRLVTHFATPDFWPALGERARLHQLEVPLARALRFARDFFGTEVDAALAGRGGPIDALIRRRLLARDNYGMPTAPLTRQALYVRSHWLRMPPALLARHLFTKWRMRRSAEAQG